MPQPTASILEHFKEVPDPRLERQKLHQLLDIIVIAICAVICGADTWVDVELFGQSKLDWLKSFLELPNGIPSQGSRASEFRSVTAHRPQALETGKDGPGRNQSQAPPMRMERAVFTEGLGRLVRLPYAHRLRQSITQKR